MRTTLDIADPVLADLRRLQEQTGQSLGELASELLAHALAAREQAAPPAQPFRWNSQPMGALVDLQDKEALYRALDSKP